MGKDLKGKELGKGISQRKDKLYYARKMVGGRSIGKCFLKLSEARLWYAETETGIENNTFHIPKKITYDSWFSYWMENVKGNKLAYRTRESYLDLYNRHVKEFIGNLYLDSIKPIQCMSVLLNMEHNGFADSTIKKVRTNMHDCFECAVENDLIVKNPITRSISVKGVEKSERYVLTIAEQRLFLDYVLKNNPNGEAFAFILETGLRYGELAALKLTDVDFERKTLTISRSLYYNRDLKRYVEKAPKSKAGFRTVPLTERAIEILLERRKNEKNLPVIIPYHEYIFRNQNGNPLDKAVCNKSLKSVMKRLGLPHISLHCLRHTFATRCIEAGMRPKTLQKILGHSSLSVTMDLYVHVTDEELTTEIERYESFIREVV